MGRQELKWRQLKTISYLARKDLILVHVVQLKPMVKVQISGRMASIGISDVVTTSLYSYKTCIKKLIMMMKMIIIIYYYYHELIARNDGFSRAPEIDFRYETKARKVVVDFKFEAKFS